MSINIIEHSTINSPGALPVEEGVVAIKMNKQYRIARCSFTFEKPLTLSQNNDLVFEVCAKTPELIGADILLGDVGFPEICIENTSGETYRLKRGNVKDFLSIHSMECEQNVRLPLGAFIYNIDLKSNKRGSGNFWDLPLKKLYFDFLANEESDIFLDIKNPRFEESDLFQIELSDLLNIERLNAAGDNPTFLTHSNSISLAITKKSVAKKLYPKKLKLNWHVSDGSSLVREGQLTLSDSKVYVEIPTRNYGPSFLGMELVYEGEVCTKASISLVKAKERANRGSSILGISDGFRFNEINCVGGEYRRIVLGLTKIVKDGESYRFASNNDPLHYLNRDDLKNYIIAFKGMPRWLSKKPDLQDFYRYGPSCINEYKSLMNWLVNKLDKLGVYAIECWNEANVIHEWNDGFDNLLDMQKAIYSIGGADKLELKVLSPSSTSWDFKFFEALYELGVYDYSDGLSMHGYTYEPDSYQYLFKKLERFIQKAAKNRKEFKGFITEVGFRTPAFSDYQQALYLTLFSLRTFFSRDLESIIWFRYRNPRPESLSSYDQNASSGYAMVGYQDMYVRPALAAYRFLDNFLENASPVRMVRNQNQSIFEAESDNYELLISYSASKTHEVECDSYENYYDLYGNCISSESISNDKSQELIFATKRIIKD